MNTPIYDFVRKYASSKSIRAHMPGHKGVSRLGVEGLDITEITGADSLYGVGGIIGESEKNASALFGAHTLYSTEGSSLSIRAMLAMIARYSAGCGKKAKILVARNVHKSFVYGAALLGIEIEWIWGDSYLSFSLDCDEIEKRVLKSRPSAVYITSPDYLGRMADVERIAEVCHRHGALFAVDNAHGAYLKFLAPSRHPIDLGADLVCDSAHKTLPVLTGGGYLHISKRAPKELLSYARTSMELFGSTSPSYLILESLDLCNKELFCGYAERISSYVEKIEKYTQKLNTGGFSLISDEPFKITIEAKKYGYYGYELGAALEKRGIYPEFCDRDYLVLMLTPDIEEADINKIVCSLLSIPRKPEIKEEPPRPSVLESALDAKEAALSPTEAVPVLNSAGRILASASVGCPPAVPLAVLGERIDEKTRDAFIYYGIEKVTVIKE
ncbi:MAG: aminotransferase class V-fold PLP-dependent enzyme [Clostridia bacterium]|nr:aminotransferase class V-fold PLP-dependent enzyme [Clostridia bacterium]